MHYVKQFDINGVATKQVACIELHGKPNAATEGCVGVLGIDMDSPTHEVYKCSAVNGSIYTWELLSSGMSIMSASISGGGVDFVEFPYANIRIPATYVVKVGDLILDKDGYLYQISALNSTYCVASYCTRVVAYGMSAYDLAVKNGYEGSEEEWMLSLQGKGLSVKANKSSCTELGDGYIDTNGDLQILTTLPSTFTNCGQIRGPQGDDGNGISIIDSRYGVSDSASNSPQTWSSNIQVAAGGLYLWTMLTFYLTDGRTSHVCICTRQPEDGKNGTSVTVTNVSESAASGGSNVVTFSDGKTLTVKNGKDGADGTDGKTPYIQDGYWYIDGVNTNVKAEGGTGTVNDTSETFDDVVLVENAYDESTAKFNVRLAGNTGVEGAWNGSLATDYIKVKYDPDAYVLISGIEKLILSYDMYFSVNYYKADKSPTGTKIMAHTQFGTYDGTLPCSFPIFKPTANSESEIVGIEDTEYVRIKLGITTKATAISATDCEGLSIKIATKADISKKSFAIPSHWEATVAEKTETIKALQTNGGKNCISFAWASDTHIPNNAAGRTDYIGKVMARMLDNCEAPFAVITGDAVTRGSMPTEEEYLAEQAQVPLHLAPLWGTDRLLVALGNHDGCWGDNGAEKPTYYVRQFTPEKMWDMFFRYQALDFNRVFSEDGTYYYVDNIPQKTRFIILNSQFGGKYEVDANGLAVNNRFKTSCYGQTQLDWLADVALDMPSGYGAIIFTHVPPRGVNGNPNPYTVDYAQFNGIINAYCNKTTYSGSFSGVSGWTSNSVSVDFTNAQGEIIALFAGHIHEDTIDTDTLECPIITVTAGGAPSNNTDQIYNRPYGTGLETSFDVVTINRATKMIYCTRVGAGSDRAVSYAGADVKTYTVTWVVDGKTTTETYTEGATPSFKGSTAKASDGQYNYTFTGWSPSIAPVTGNVSYTAQYSKTEIVPDVKTYTVTFNSINCTNSNSATTVTEGSAYNAIITANDGYCLDRVDVTMGGNAVSVAIGTINIASVTGDIVITAVAIEQSTEPSYTNLAEPNETNETDFTIWCNKSRMGSNGAYRVNASTITTNYMPIAAGDIIRVKGLVINAASTDMTVGSIGLFKSDKALAEINTFADTVSKGRFTISGSADSGYTLVYGSGNSFYNEVKYFRIVGALTGTVHDVIITKNEPIE